jgi:valyl-tRNA synthetase
MPTQELPKTYNPREVEESLYQWWEESGFFRAEIDWTKEPFVIAIPPPNVTGELHMGHAMFVTLEDIMTRYHRMRGKVALWLPGTDHAGIATQLQVEKLLMQTEGKTRWDVGRADFEDMLWEWKERYGGYITKQLRRLGASCDWSRERFTLDEGLSEAVKEAFVRLFDKGLIYRGTYLVNWSPNLQTAVSDLEVEYSTEPGTLYFFKYLLKDSDDFIPVATTRPETILGDTAVAVHPEDERYRHLVGKTVIVPILGREIPVIADDYVEREFGTGALKITPGHDPNDYDIGKRHGLPILNIMNKDATLNEEGGPYAGLPREEARARLWADMRAAGLTIREQPHELNVPRTQRGGEIVEPMVSTQWFVRMDEMAAKGLAAVRGGDIRIIPERFEKVYYNWLDNIRDWTISRQLWWGHRIPIWYVDGDEERFVAARDEAEAWERARARFGEVSRLDQEEDVLDTWFSSGLWPFSTLGWPNDTEELRYFYPTSVMETGYDILFFWVARMIMMGLEFTEQAPFHTVYLHGLVRDEHGAKMSKTKGNVIDPLVAAGEYGTDALRFTLVTGATPGQDMNLNMERVEANRNFANKLWNTARFTLHNLGAEERAEIDTPHMPEARFVALPLAERWIVSRLNQLIAEATRHIEEYNFGEAGRALYNFIWGEFADWYIEAAKTRLYSDDEAAQHEARAVLLHVLERTLRLLHPFMPFITETIWQNLPHAKETPSLMLAVWPEPGPVDAEAIAQFEALQDLIRAIRNTRQEYGVEPARKIAGTIVAARNFAEVEASREMIALLARLDEQALQILPALDTPQEQAAHLVAGEGLEAYLPLAGMVDLEREMARLREQMEQARGEIERLNVRLANPGFVNKAAPNIVQGARDQLHAAQERLAKLEERQVALNGGR